MKRSKVPELVRSVVKRHLTEICGFDQAILNDSARLDQELNVRSIVFVEVQVAIEDDLDIELDPMQMIELNRLDLIFEYVSELTARRWKDVPAGQPGWPKDTP